MYRIEKDLGYFAASHNLPDHDGGCYNLHGHNYGVLVEIEGEPSSSQGVPYSGMLIDFTHIKTIYKDRVHSVVDHAHIIAQKQPEWYIIFVDALESLNPEGDRAEAQAEVDRLLGKVAHLPIPDSTAEHLAAWVYKEMQAGLENFLAENNIEHTVPIRISSVTVTETETSIAKYIP